MTKSIITGLGVLAAVVALALAVLGVWETGLSGLLTIWFVGFIWLIFFARFGGFKPFFADDELAEEGVVRQAENAAPRSLVSVGAEGESQSLFGEREPLTPPTVRGAVFDESRQPVAESIPGETLFDDIQNPTPVEKSPIRIKWPDDSPRTNSGADGPSSEATIDEPTRAVADSKTELVEVDHRVGDDTDSTDDREDVGEDADLASTAPSPAQAPTIRSDIDVTVSTGPVELDDFDAENLAASMDSLAPADPATSPAIDYRPEPVVSASTGLAVATGTDLPVVVNTPAPLELHRYTSNEIMDVVRTQESHLVDTLIDEGVLSTEGPLTDKDIRTMVFVAVSSTELIDVLTEGQREAVALQRGSKSELGTGDS